MANVITSHYQKIKIGREPVVVVPIRQWKKIEDALEDLDMYLSKTLRKNIRKARLEVERDQVFTLKEAQEKLGSK